MVWSFRLTNTMAEEKKKTRLDDNECIDTANKKRPRDTKDDDPSAEPPAKKQETPSASTEREVVVVTLIGFDVDACGTVLIPREDLTAEDLDQLGRAYSEGWSLDSDRFREMAVAAAIDLCYSPDREPECNEARERRLTDNLRGWRRWRVVHIFGKEHDDLLDGEVCRHSFKISLEC